MADTIKSGKEILEEFFSSIETINGVDKEIAKSLALLYSQGKLSDTNIKQELQKLREKNESKDQKH